MRVIQIETNEVVKCKGCGKDNWIIIQSNANHYNKYICNHCGNERTMYTFPPKYKHG